MTDLATVEADGRLNVHLWDGHLLDQLGLDPRSFYCETFWLPLLGPTSTWLLRRIAFYFESAPSGFEVDVLEWARCLGVGHKAGAVLIKAFRRLVRFDLARDCGPADLDVLRRVPVLRHDQLKRLPKSLHAAHERWRAEQLVVASTSFAATPSGGGGGVLGTTRHRSPGSPLSSVPSGRPTS